MKAPKPDHVVDHTEEDSPLWLEVVLAFVSLSILAVVAVLIFKGVR